MSHLLCDFLLMGVFAKLVFESAILKFVEADISSDSSRKKSVGIEHDHTLDVVGLSAIDTA